MSGPQRRHSADPPAPVQRAKDKSATKPAVLLAERIPLIRNQGHRGTCVAFASAAFLEYHLYNASPKTMHHSEQFLFWACKQFDGSPQEDGTDLIRSSCLPCHLGENTNSAVARSILGRPKCLIRRSRLDGPPSRF